MSVEEAKVLSKMLGFQIDAKFREYIKTQKV